MSERMVFNVATGSYLRGQRRLAKRLEQLGEPLRSWDAMPPGCPPHAENPYAFKAHALNFALTLRDRPTTLLWMDASIWPAKPLDALWERIERDGYWVARNGWNNDEWTADSAYSVLFPDKNIGDARRANKKVPHVVATAFGLSLDHDIGREALRLYKQYADAGAFRGPWSNSNHPDCAHQTVNARCSDCGPPDVRGHRHDQTALSIIAYRLGMVLTNPPDIFAYANANGSVDERTILVADGGFVHGGS